MWYAYVTQDLFLHMKCGEERKVWLDVVILFKKVNVSDQGKWLIIFHFYSNNGTKSIFHSKHHIPNIMLMSRTPFTTFRCLGQPHCEHLGNTECRLMNEKEVKETKEMIFRY